MLIEAKNPLDHNIRGESVALLQAALSDAIDLTAQTKQAHWNVKGRSFIALHELFDDLHGRMDEHADTLAERMVALGGQTQGTVQDVAKASRLTVYPDGLVGGRAHADALSTAYSEFSRFLQDGIAAADGLGDPITADVFTSIARNVDKSIWFIEAHLVEESP